MFVTAAICTWNRAGLLDQTLAQMRELRIPAAVEWEVLVVNNNCTDDTDAVIARHAEHLPVRRLFEPTPGQTSARNCAIDAACGELILWTDDDVLVDADWLAEYVQAAEQWPDAAFFGGPIKPWFESRPPRWLPRILARVEPAYALRDFGTQPLPFNEQRFPYGANFAVRTDVQRKYRYDPSIGLKPNSSVRHDETTVLMQMLADGLQGMYVPSAKVDHFIPTARQTTKHLRNYCYGLGVYDARALYNDLAGSTLLFGRPRWLWRWALVAELRYRLDRCFRRPEVWINSLMNCSRIWGRLHGSRDRLNPELIPQTVVEFGKGISKNKYSA